MAWVNPRTWVAGVTHGTAAIMNEIRDSLKAIGDAGGTYAPVLTASSVNPTPGATAFSGSYRLAGKWADVHMNVVIGAGFAAGTGNYRLSLPAAVVPLRTSSAEEMGVATVFDTSTGNTYVFHVLYISSTTVSFLNAVGTMNSTTPMAWASGDRISVHIPSLECA